MEGSLDAAEESCTVAITHASSFCGSARESAKLSSVLSSHLLRSHGVQVLRHRNAYSMPWRTDDGQRMCSALNMPRTNLCAR